MSAFSKAVTAGSLGHYHESSEFAYFATSRLSLLEAKWFGDSQMTEYELVDALGTYASAMQAWAATYISVLSAYCVVAYMAGKNLSTSQAMIIGTGFVFFAFMCAANFYGISNRTIEFAAELKQLRPDRIYVASDEALWVISLIMLFGIIACLKFMWDIRHPKTE